ncbi:hypothetical protein Droror1_Dr00015500 [Drosera rotundifolia]
MDSPERAQIQTPISKNEDTSPYSNYVNSLSPIPIKPIKGRNISQSFSSLNFTSPPPVFASPQVNLQQESRFLESHPLLELTKPEFTSNDDRTAPGTEGAMVAAPQLESSSTEGVQHAGIPFDHGAGFLVRGASGETIEMPMELRYCGANPSCTTEIPSCSDMRCNTDTFRSVPFGEGSTVDPFFAAECSSHAAQENNEETNSYFDSLISDDVEFIEYCSPNGTVDLKGESQRTRNVDFLPPYIPRFFQVVVNSQQNICHPGSMSSGYQNGSKDQFSESGEPSGENQIHQVPDSSMMNNSMNDFQSNSPSEYLENELTSNGHRVTRRRCLVFEQPVTRKNLEGGPFSSSLNPLLEGNNGNVNKQMDPLITRNNTPPYLVSGIGLHLNALAVASKESRHVKQEAVCSQENTAATEKTTLECVAKSSDVASLKKEMDLGEITDQIAEEASRTSVSVAEEELGPNSPKKKRRKSDNIDSCKRCKCKKSKCLKLYCDCFAAGIFCMDSCSCEGCFNKPIHSKTVQDTRKQIESRNPLAFAPKVIRAADASPDLKDDSTTTPASARHKRGCNCKKSGCLKKYCECYQGGVGCTVSCRCEGCQNLFGRKDVPGHLTMTLDAEIEEESPGSEKSSAAQCFVQPEIPKSEQNSESAIPRTPMQVLRSSVVHPICSMGKPPLTPFGVGGSGSSFSMLHPCKGSLGSTFLRPEPKIEKHDNISGDDLPGILQGNNSSPSKTGIKTLSPNKKRVSPPHHDSGRSPPSGPKATRKLILKSIPQCPSFTPDR